MLAFNFSFCSRSITVPEGINTHLLYAQSSMYRNTYTYICIYFLRIEGNLKISEMYENLNEQ